MKQTRRVRHGFSLIEAVISTIVVSLLLVAAIGTVRSARMTQVSITLRSRGAAMGNALMNEILSQPYADPTQAAIFGLEAGEAAATRAAYDDVDDYHGLDESPPLTRAGGSLDSTGRWKRTASVVWVDPGDTTRVMNTESGVKRITVEVFFGSQPVATLVSLRSQYP